MGEIEETEKLNEKKTEKCQNSEGRDLGGMLAFWEKMLHSAELRHLQHDS